MESSAEKRREIESANAEFEAKFAAGDIAGVAALYTDDAKFIAPHQDTLSGRAAIQAFLQGARDAGVASIGLTVLEVEADETSAIDLGRYEMKSADGDVIDSGDYMVYWKKQDGVWKLHRDCISTDSPVPEA